MSMTLRGMGCHKRDLIQGIRSRFGYHHFSFQEVSGITGFDRSTFFRLYSDKMILRVRIGKPLLYRLATRYSKNGCGVVPAESLASICPEATLNYTTPREEYPVNGGDIV